MPKEIVGNDDNIDDRKKENTATDVESKESIVMKKKVISILLVSVFFGGVVSASSLWGTYKGNEVIRITSEGKNVSPTDVPALSLNGRTMIPINMLNQLGVQYTWDQVNKTVNVDKQKDSATPVNANNKDSVLKANLFKYLEDLGEDMNSAKTSFDIAMLSKTMGTSPSSTSKARLANIINDYNNFIKRPDAINYGALDPSINKSLDSYYDGIDKLKEIDKFIDYLPQKADVNALNQYSILTNSAGNTIDKGINLSREGFKNYIYEATK